MAGGPKTESANMRAVIVGAGKLGLMTAQLLSRRHHEIVIIEKDREVIDNLAEEMDCGVLHGDGSKPAILLEADPPQTDILYCLTGSDEINILSSLVGRSLGFKRVVTKIDEPEFEHICIELGLGDTIIPSRTIGRDMADMIEGKDILELTTLVRDEGRVFSFVAREEDAVALGELGLPEESRVICLYRGEKFVMPEEDSRLERGDEVIMLTHVKHLPRLNERFHSP